MNKDGKIEIEKIFSFKNHDYFIIWPEDIAEISLVHTDSENKVSVIEGTREISVKKGTHGMLCFDIVDATWGCSITQCISFVANESVFSVFESLYDSDQHGYSGDFDLIDALQAGNYPYPIPYGYIHREGYGEPCEPKNNDHNSKILSFIPHVDNENPCWSGGLIGTQQGNIVVPLSASGTLVSAGNNRYCLWPPGVLESDNTFIKLAQSTILSQYFPLSPYTNFVVPDNPFTLPPADPYEAAVIALVSVPTITPGGGGNGLPGGAGNGENPVLQQCDALDNPCGDGIPCIFVTEDDCSYSVYCNAEDIGNEELIVGAVEGLNSMCFRNSTNTNGCQIVFQCSVNDCDITVVASSLEENNYISIESLEAGINALKADLKVVAEVVLADLLAGNCGGDGECSCAEISSEIGECFACFGGNDSEEKLLINPFNLSTGDVHFNGAQPKKDILVTVYPNPFGKDLNVEIFAQENISAHIVISNLLGESVWRKKVTLGKGKNIFNWQPETSLPTGIYNLHIIDALGNQSIKKVIYSNHY